MAILARITYTRIVLSTRRVPLVGKPPNTLGLQHARGCVHGHQHLLAQVLMDGRASKRGDW
jgi:hypothetical protein